MTERTSPSVGSLSPERRTLLDQWAGAAAGAGTTARPVGRIPRRSAESPAPLSCTQERLWFLEQLHPGQSIYVIPVVLRLRVAVSVDALQRALDEMVWRHVVLRSSFVMVEGVPHQVPEAAAPCPLRVVDLRHLPEGDRLVAARDHLHHDQASPFDLTTTCRLRAMLVTLDANDHVLVATFHHIAFDGWSTAPFLHELTALYTAFVQGASSPLRELPIQYADYATWQRALLADPAVRGPLIDYWTRTLSGARVPEIQPDRPRPLRPTYRAGRHVVTLPAEVVSALRMLAQREGVTPFMVLLAAVNVLVQRHSARDDVSVGTSVAGRSHPELEPLIGCCLNTLVLRTDLSGDPRVSALLGRVRETALGAFAHQALPFEVLLQHLQPARDLSRTPLFQVYVNYLNVGELDPAVGHAEAGDDAAASARAADAPVAADDTHSPFDVSLYARPVHDSLVLTLVHAHDLFDATTAVRLLCDLRALVTHMVEQPDARISTLDLSPAPAGVSPTSRLRVPAPEGWQPWATTPSDASIADRFADVARRHAHVVAVRCGAVAMTYELLAERSTRLARRLQATAGHGERVGLLLGHDPSMIAALLGVLQTGAAYVPLDPAHPIERLEAVVATSRPAVLLVDRSHRGIAGALAERLPGTRIALLESLLEDGPDRPEPQPEQVQPDALAYVLFTSGSTGTPKGVMQCHRHVLSHVRAYVDSVRIGPGDTLSLLPTYGFDASVMDIFGALLSGATLQLMALRTDDDQVLAAAMSNVTVLHATPTVFRHLLSSPPIVERTNAVRVVVLGGEPALRTDVDLFRRVFPRPCVLVNGLGPTESTVALQYVLDHDTDVSGAVLPVGHAVAGTDIRLVNTDRQDVGMLAIGEIAITSEQVALGYWEDEPLTSRVFASDISGTRRRTYFSGDLGWRDRDGCVHFAGRRDGQLKVRGVRIEADEVEHRLLECQGVVAAAVTVTTQAARETLTAHVVWGADATPDATALRAHLLRHLPDAMVPTEFVLATRLPRTPGGKIDRAALPTPTPATVVPFVRGATQAAPETTTERQLAAVWCEVLALTSVGRFDNFFELGGHSLLATQVVSRVRSTMGRALALRACFEAPTLAALADLIDQAPREDTPPPRGNSAAVHASRDRYKVRLS